MFKYNEKLMARAQEMRKNMTLYENALWYKFLNAYPIRFRRQRIIGNYIADFYCSKAKLIIELDGSHHYQESNKEYDDIRTAFFNSLGINVLRFTNSEVKYNFDDVCKTIDTEVKSRT